jgi:hypothetical protein
MRLALRGGGGGRLYSFASTGLSRLKADLTLAPSLGRRLPLSANGAVLPGKKSKGSGTGVSNRGR